MEDDDSGGMGAAAWLVIILFVGVLVTAVIAAGAIR
jgi:hypothetical protein